MKNASRDTYSQVWVARSIIAALDATAHTDPRMAGCGRTITARVRWALEHHLGLEHGQGRGPGRPKMENFAETT